MDPMNEWMEAHNATVAKIEAHPRFPHLVREVAVAEQPHKHRRLARNSPTFAVWSTRGEAPRRAGSYARRAWLLAAVIGQESGVLSSSPVEDTRRGAAYVAALNHVRARTSGGTR